jgi:glycosyltransferase involved in cell wall biosynthesis
LHHAFLPEWRAGPDEHGLTPNLLARLSGAVRHVHAIGAIHGADKWSLVKDADALVQCSDSESFGMSVIESLACAVPVIVTRTCPWSEIEANSCGFWVEQTAPAIAAAMNALAGDPALRHRMGGRGAAFAHDGYSWDDRARMARLYADLT